VIFNISVQDKKLPISYQLILKLTTQYDFQKLVRFWYV